MLVFIPLVQLLALLIGWASALCRTAMAIAAELKPPIRSPSRLHFPATRFYTLLLNLWCGRADAGVQRNECAQARRTDVR